MIGIYQDSFKDFLEENLDGKIKTNARNIICKCPWCDYGKKTSKDHLYISLEIPIFHCFRASCNAKGHVGKLISKITGSDISDNFIDKEKIKKPTQKIECTTDQKKKQIILPKIRTDIFPNKTLYTRKRLKFANIDLNYVKGLIFDVNQFIQINNITIDPILFRIKDYLHTNFVGFLSEHKSLAIFRNIDPTATFRFFKLKISNLPFLDYYKILGGSKKSKTIILAEGIFDIYSTKLFDFLNINNNVRLYAAALSSKYASLLQSIVFYEQEYRLDVIILSDNGIHPNYYRKIKKNNEQIINTCSVYYNKSGKDFNENTVTLSKITI